MAAAGLFAGSSALRAGKDLIRSWHPGRNRGKHMNASLLAVLSDAERLLVAQTEPAELAALDEDAAIEFESRIRRARNKYVSQYRRGASARVAELGGRGKARPQNTRAALKAEAFEEDRKSTRLNSSHPSISYAVFCLKKKTNKKPTPRPQAGTLMSMST